MIVEEPQNNNLPVLSMSKTSIAEKILLSIKETYPHFKNAISNTAIIKPINENKYTQVFVEQLNYQLIKSNFAFLAANQYSDLFYKTKGVPDFYFHNLEEGVTSAAILVVEAKILPSPPPAIRKREYAFGDNIKSNGVKESNGGIERFKIEKHGYGLSESALIAFVENDSHENWLSTINQWIRDLSVTEKNWHVREILQVVEKTIGFSYLKSTGCINPSKEIILHHFWLNIN